MPTTTTTTKLTEEYIAQHPSIKDCLKNNLINYSKLSRRIAKELGIEKERSIEAILVACRRFAQKIKKETVQEEQILKILKDSELEIKNRIVVAIVEKSKYHDSIEQKIRKEASLFYAIEGTTVFTIIAQEKFLDSIQESFSPIEVFTDLALITIKTSKEIEDTPGVMAYLYSLFYDHGVNIVEQMSCWTDTMFVVKDKDIPCVMDFLKF